MGLARVDIQELGPGRWVVELESGTRARHRRQSLRAKSFDEAMALTGEAYRTTMEPSPVKAAPEAFGPAEMPAKEPPAAATAPAAEPPVAEEEVLTGRVTEDQVVQAEELGVRVDRRWSAARAQQVIDEKLAE